MNTVDITTFPVNNAYVISVIQTKLKMNITLHYLVTTTEKTETPQTIYYKDNATKHSTTKKNNLVNIIKSNDPKVLNVFSKYITVSFEKRNEYFEVRNRNNT